MIIRDPIHGNIELTNAEQALIKTKVFQRLQYIKQLSMIYLVYPGAMHSRFEHSLGTMHLANKAGIGLGIKGEELAGLRIAALLHDVGHPAFSHLAEIFLKSNHETMSVNMINESRLSRIMEKHGINVKSVTNIILNDKCISHQVIDNDIDVDRIDYLIRDAHHCGVAYGKGVDADRLLYTLVNHKGSIVLDRKGLRAAEALLFARYIMRETVYNHKIGRICDAMLCYCLSKALKNKVFKKNDLFRMNDSEVINSLINSGDKEIKRQAGRLIKRNLLKQAVVREYRELSDDEKPVIRRMAVNWKLKEEKEKGVVMY